MHTAPSLENVKAQPISDAKCFVTEPHVFQLSAPALSHFSELLDSEDSIASRRSSGPKGALRGGTTYHFTWQGPIPNTAHLSIKLWARHENRLHIYLTLKEFIVFQLHWESTSLASSQLPLTKSLLFLRIRFTKKSSLKTNVCMVTAWEPRCRDKIVKEP